MSKMNLQQLQSKSRKELMEVKAKAEKRQKELEQLKAKGGKDWTIDLQDELNEVTLFLVDVEELIETKEDEPAASTEYTPEKGTEKLVQIGRASCRERV